MRTSYFQYIILLQEILINSLYICVVLSLKNENKNKNIVIKMDNV